MGEDTDYIFDNAPIGATHYGYYKTGKFFYALEYYNINKLDYLIWFGVQQRYYSVSEINDKLTSLK